MNDDMQRLFAFGVDGAICYGIYMVVSTMQTLLTMPFLMKVQQGEADGIEAMIFIWAAGALVFIGSVFFAFLYFVIPTAIWGKTLGKLIFRVKVEYHGNPPGFLRAAAREFLKLIQWVFFLIPIFALYQVLEYGYTWYDRLLGLDVRCDAFGLTETQKNWRKLHDRHTPAAQDARKKWPLWKGCLLLVIAATVLAACFGGMLYISYKRYFSAAAAAAAAITIKPLSETEQAALQEAFDRLEAALKEHAPALLAKRKPLQPEQLEALRNSLNGQTSEPLEMWYSFFAGLEEYEVIPGEQPAEPGLAAMTRGINHMMLHHGVAPQRTKSLMLLHDGSGDGYFLLLEEPGNVFYDMLEAPSGDTSFGTMTRFVNQIAEAIEKKFWTYDQHGKLIDNDDGIEKFWALRPPAPRPRKHPGYY